MGYGNYSYNGKSYRTASKGKILNIKADDITAVSNILTNNSFANMNAGSYVTMSVTGDAEVKKIEAFLEARGISANYTLVDDKYTGYATKGIHETFTNRQINNAMNPYGITVRESRDSDEHPNSLAIIVGLDETGSMGTVPHYLVKEGLPLLIDRLIKGGIANPQVLFMGLGDHECDQAPLQVGQFESSDDLMDKWLTDLYLEGRGGGNAGESYLLAWYFAAYHTAIDCLEKRGKKGYCITIGDEPTLRSVLASFLKKLMGPGQYENYSADDLLAEAREKYNVFHINIGETSSGSRQSVKTGWTELLRDNFVNAPRKEMVAEIIADIILKNEAGSNIITQPDQNKPASFHDVEIL
jgi:hypothetical protein